MRATKHRLTAREVQTLGPGKHGDGGGLYLIVEGPARRWQFRYLFEGKRRELGLGGLRKVSLANARVKAAEAAECVGKGMDPLQVRDDQKAAAQAERAAAQTFGDFADAWFEASVAPGLRNAKHVWQWRQTLGDDYCLAIRGKSIASIDTADVLAVLKPVWNEKPETATRLRGRIERVLDAATVMGARGASANPARWRGHLDNLLPQPSKLTRGHHAAMPWSEIPAFMKRLAEREAMTALALQFIILTCARAGEALQARWSEMDLEAKVWTVPAPKMKGGKQHRVPLTDAALAILERVQPLAPGRHDALVFPGPGIRPMGSEALEALRKRMGAGAYTTHGFRSAFRDWAGEMTDAPREIAEGCLAHEVGNAVERAYRRGDALEKRRQLLHRWAGFCERSYDGGAVRLAC